MSLMSDGLSSHNECDYSDLNEDLVPPDFSIASFSTGHRNFKLLPSFPILPSRIPPRLGIAPSILSFFPPDQ